MLNDLLVWADGRTTRPSLFHYRSAAGSEIDLVVEQGRRLLPTEIKASPEPRVDDGRALAAFCDEHGGRAPFGLLIHGGTEAFALSRKVLAVPLGAVV